MKGPFVDKKTALEALKRPESKGRRLYSKEISKSGAREFYLGTTIELYNIIIEKNRKKINELKIKNESNYYHENIEGEDKVKLFMDIDIKYENLNSKRKELESEVIMNLKKEKNWKVK